MSGTLLRKVVLGDFEVAIGMYFNGKIVTKIMQVAKVTQSTNFYHEHVGWQEETTSSDVFNIYAGEELIGEIQRAPGIILSFLEVPAEEGK